MSKAFLSLSERNGKHSTTCKAHKNRGTLYFSKRFFGEKILSITEGNGYCLHFILFARGGKLILSFIP